MNLAKGTGHTMNTTETRLVLKLGLLSCGKAIG